MDSLSETSTKNSARRLYQNDHSRKKKAQGKYKKDNVYRFRLPGNKEFRIPGQEVKEGLGQRETEEDKNMKRIHKEIALFVCARVVGRLRVF
jgi:hypothetical protein